MMKFSNKRYRTAPYNLAIKLDAFVNCASSLKSDEKLHKWVYYDVSVKILLFYGLKLRHVHSKI